MLCVVGVLDNDYAYFYKTGGPDGTYSPGARITGNPRRHPRQHRLVVLREPQLPRPFGSIRGPGI